jgi:SMODS and SLOG-associating 2TM effector domain 3
VPRPALLARFPRFVRRRLPPDWPVVPDGAEAQFPRLAEDLQLWRTRLEDRFRELDHRALRLQQQFWRQQVTLLLGGLLATALGAYQAAQGSGNPYVAVVQAVVTGLLAGVTVLARGQHAQRGYLTARLKAERIKSEFFLFLGCAAGYDDGDRVVRLLQQVEDIEDAEEVA